MMLNNGCICCTVRGDLVCMIVELVERKKGKFDHIVIETTGNLISLNSFPQCLSGHLIVKYEFLN